jgi:hypothetical protein
MQASSEKEESEEYIDLKDDSDYDLIPEVVITSS